MIDHPGVYAITNKLNHKQYIGSTVGLSKRQHDHLSYLRRNRHWNYYLQSSFNLHGEGTFSFTPFVVCEPWELIRYEQALIDLLKPEYNICPMAGRNRAGAKLSEESKRKISEVQIGREHGPRTEEHKHKISESLKGHSTSQETISKISNTLKGKTHKGNHDFKQTEESRQKISESMRRYRASQRCNND